MIVPQLSAEQNLSGALAVGRGEKGEQGPVGPKGEKGEPGYTPVKGVDYFHQEDIEKIREGMATKDYIDAILGRLDEELGGIQDGVNGKC